MKLLDVLAAGVRGAENGSVDILVRGTSTHAQVFTDYDGAGAQTPTVPLTLDANGGAVWYVNQPVLCKAYDASGTIVRQFTAFETATDVEVRSQSFTGIDYTTGASAAGNPTLLSTVLDLWKTSAGAIDWKVLLAGTATNLQSAFGPIAGGLFFNVKDPAYAAKGDGVTDDRAAIQAAATAAGAVGGWLVFPPVGTGSSYLIGAPGITCNGVAGILAPHGASLTTTAGGMTQWTINTPPSNKFMMLGVTASCQALTTWINQTAGDLLLQNVSYTCPVHAVSGPAQAITMTGSADALTIIDSNLVVPIAITGLTCIAAKSVFFLYAEISTVANGGNVITRLVDCTDGIIAGCNFASQNTMQAYIRRIGAGQALAVVGCDFANPSAGSITSAMTNGGSNIGLFEAGNSFGSAIAVITSAAADLTDVDHQTNLLLSLRGREHFETNDTAAFTLDSAAPRSFGTFRIRRTTAGAQIITTPTPASSTDELVLHIINDSVGGPVITLTTIKGLASVTPGAGTRQMIVARAALAGGALSWVLVSSTNWT